MFARSAPTVRSRVSPSLLLGAIFLVLSCQSGIDSVVAPQPGASGVPFQVGGATRAVLPGQKAHFYIHGFVDNWPLFMGDRVPASLTGAAEVVFIALSAGDANLPMAFVTTRETGSLASIDALLGVTGSWSCSNQVVLTHPIRRCVKGKAVSYYMRLPDGSPAGEGYGNRGSMAMLRDGWISSLTTIDGTTTYSSWSDLTNTIRGIVDLESGNQSAPYVEINAPDHDRALNPGDHPDNQATADAVLASASARSWDQVWYVDYRTQNLAANVSQAAHDVKQNAYYAYDAVMASGGYGANRFEPDVQAWLWRTYSRSVTSAPPPPATVPAAPSALSAQGISSSRIDVAWTNNATDATSVVVERAPDVSGAAGTYAVAATLGATASTYNESGLAANARYWYRVQARNAAGGSTYSNAAAASTLALPAAPTALTAQAITSTRIDLAWIDAAANETGYTVERAPDVSGAPGTFATLATLAAGSTSYSNTALTQATRYWYRVRAFNDVDVSDYSANASATTAPTPPVPSGFTATAVSSSRLDLAWTDTPSEVDYTLERAPDNAGVAGTFAALATLPANTTSYADQTGLSPATRYWYRLRANAAAEPSSFTTPVSATTLTIVPAAPSGLAAVSLTSSQINLTWTDNATNETGYTVQRAPDVSGAPGTFATVATLAAGAASYSNTGLTASTRYWYRVRAFNAVDVSAFSANASATTAPTPPVPSGFTATAVSSSRINLAWTDTPSEVDYTLERAPDNSGSAGTFAPLATLPANSTSYADQSGLNAATRYWYRLRANVAAEPSSFTTPASATTFNVAPAAPSGLTAATASSSQINLAWSDNATNETSYSLERAPTVSGAPGTFAEIASLPANTTTYSNTGLTASTRYWYRVRAVNGVGPSGYSATADATTAAPPTSSRIDVFAHAHEDDWQLFMGEVAWKAVPLTTKLVFIYTSAGDANEGTAYWVAREGGAEAAMSALPVPAGTWSCANQTVSGHPIRRCGRGMMVAYYLRLPDGALSGEGFGTRGSLALLRDGDISSFRAMDNSTTYTSWTDLVQTVRGIVDLEAGGAGAHGVEVHAPDINRTINTGDHPDHTATGDLINASVASRSWNQNWYVDYSIQNKTINLTQTDHDRKQTLFYAYDAVVGGGGFGYAKYESSYQAWLWRSYSRRIAAP